VVFEANHDEIELRNIVMTSFQWHHHHYVTKKVTKIMSQKFFQCGPLLIKITGYASASRIHPCCFSNSRNL